MHPVPPVRGPRESEILQRLLVLAHGMRRLLVAWSWFDERRAFDPLTLRVAAECEPAPCIAVTVQHALLCRFHTASAALERLRMHLLLEEVDTEDARCRGYRLTRHGRLQVRDADAWLEMVGSPAISRVTPEALDVFVSTLRLLEIAVREEVFELECRGITGTGLEPRKRR